MADRAQNLVPLMRAGPGVGTVLVILGLILVIIGPCRGFALVGIPVAVGGAALFVVSMGLRWFTERARRRDAGP